MGLLQLSNVESKRDHLYQFWKSYIKRPMLLVGPSLGAAAAVTLLSTILKLQVFHKFNIILSILMG
ncbi:hypothetical protein Hdeb2414_s0025g00662411 [Helianthus debilis subsp. tardiflorus]